MKKKPTTPEKVRQRLQAALGLRPWPKGLKGKPRPREFRKRLLGIVETLRTAGRHDKRQIEVLKSRLGLSKVLSQKKLGEKLGVSASLIGYIEKDGCRKLLEYPKYRNELPELEDIG